MIDDINVLMHISRMKRTFYKNRPFEVNLKEDEFFCSGYEKENVLTAQKSTLKDKEVEREWIKKLCSHSPWLGKLSKYFRK